MADVGTLFLEKRKGELKERKKVQLTQLSPTLTFGLSISLIMSLSLRDVNVLLVQLLHLHLDIATFS